MGKQVTFNQWIDSKGVAKVAENLSLPVGTIYSWYHRRTIPRRAWPDVLLAYAELGLNDLIAMERASK
jgi:hypothetical protein